VTEWEFIRSNLIASGLLSLTSFVIVAVSWIAFFERFSLTVAIAFNVAFTVAAMTLFGFITYIVLDTFRCMETPIQLRGAVIQNCEPFEVLWPQTWILTLWIPLMFLFLWFRAKIAFRGQTQSNGRSANA